MHQLNHKNENGFRRVTDWLQRQASRPANDPDAPIANGWLIFYLGLVVAVMILLVGVITQWHEGSGRGSPSVDILWRITWILYSLVKIAFLVLGVIWAYRRFQKRRGERD